MFRESSVVVDSRASHIPQLRQSTATISHANVNTNTRADIGNESLRAQINTLQYELDTIKQERELERIERGAEVREAEKRAESEYKRAQVSLKVQVLQAGQMLRQFVAGRGSRKDSGATTP